MPGTRLRVLSEIMERVKSEPRRNLLLHGLAGTGKTSIAITLCRMLQVDPDVVLGGAFFCSRIANTAKLSDTRCILPTLAVSLAEHSPEFALALAKELDTNSRASLKSITLQMTSLVQQPLDGLACSGRLIVFVIDALDECSDKIEINRLLQAISVLKCSVTVKFILTSRPEVDIDISQISTPNWVSIMRLRDIDAIQVSKDIHMYINDAFSRQSLDETWYTESEVTSLAARADGLFIFAATVISYILGTRSPNWRRARLQKILSAINTAAAIAPLDTMYDLVLTRAANPLETDAEELEETKLVLACILTARVPLSVRALAELLDRNAIDIHESLQQVSAVVHVPDQYDQQGLRTLHASFGDYLLERADERFRISTLHGDDALARGCLNILVARLHFNVSQSRSSYKPNPPVPTVLDSMPLSVRYACMHWVYHVARLPRGPTLDDDIYNNFRPRFLFWLEVMSVLGEVQRAAAMLISAKSIVRPT